jgi:hypothetical protein
MSLMLSFFNDAACRYAKGRGAIQQFLQFLQISNFELKNLLKNQFVWFVRNIGQFKILGKLFFTRCYKSFLI